MNIRKHVVATAAYECVVRHRDGKGKRKVDKKKYGALVHKLPGMILQNGLAQATGYLLAKNDGEHRALLEDLRVVLCSTGSTSAKDGSSLHDEIIHAGNLETVMIHTRRTLEAFGWLKRYAQGVLRIDATGEETSDGEVPIKGR